MTTPEERKSPSPSSFKLALKQEEKKDSQKPDTTKVPEPKSGKKTSGGVGHSPGQNTFRVILDPESISKTGKHSSPPQGTVEWMIRDMDKKAA